MLRLPSVARSGLLVCLVLLTLLIESQTFGQGQIVRTQKNAERAPLQYLLYVPEEASKQDVPLVLFLHGGGEGGSDIEKVKKNGLPKLIGEGKSFPFIVVSPQNPSETQFWDDQQLIRLLDELEADLPVDRSRVYLTGLSRGGYGAWRLAIQNAGRFAALVPICGGGPAPYAGKLKDVPTWCFHGAKDPVIPLVESQRMVDALRAAGGNVKFTVYPEAKHDAWTETYNNPDLYKWLLNQQRSSAAAVSIRADFPGGNVIVEKIEGDVVTLKPDLRGGRDWFYWSFECQTNESRKLRFELPDKRTMKCIGMQGPAVSSDGGETWDWLGADSVDGAAFECAFDAGKPLRLSVTIPYMQKNLDHLLDEHENNEHLVVTELAMTTGGRAVELLQIGEPGGDRIPVMTTARHHACESMASYLLEGFLRAAMSDTEAGRSFRERYVLYCVPIVDKDGVHDGDQGKNRNPHDHNRDYIEPSPLDNPKDVAGPLYPEIAAIMKLRDSKGIRIAVDFHCPTLWMDYHQVIYFVGPKDVPASNLRNVTQLGALIKAEFPETAPRGCLVLLKSERTPGHFSDFFSRGDNTIMATTLEFPYASPGKNMSPSAIVGYGRQLLAAWNEATFAEPIPVDRAENLKQTGR